MINTKSFFILFILSCLNFSLLAGSNGNNDSLIILSDPAKEYIPLKQVLLLEDKSGKLTLPQVQALNSFFPNKNNTINEGITSSALWCKFKMKNLTREKWYIEIGEPYIDIIDLFSIDDSGKTEVINTGLLRSFKQRYVKVNHYIIPLDLGYEEEKTFYIKAKSNTILKLPLAVRTIQNHFEINHREDLTNGIYFGLIVALSLYNLFVFLLIKDKSYLYYVFYINFLGATIAWLRGYSPEFLNTISLNFNHGNNYAALTFIFLTLFTHSFLNLKKTIPQHRYLIVLFLTISIISIILTITGRFDLSFYFVMFIVTINLPYIAFFGIHALRNGFRPAIFYLLGFTFFTLGDVLFILSENAIIGQTVLSDYSLQIGSSLEAIILSFALANKLNIYKKEKEALQANALKQANQFSKELLQTQEEERKRIAGELHDSIGQSLSLLKNRVTILKKDFNKPNSLDDLNNIIANTIQEIRNITYGLRPFQLDLLGLTQSLKSLVESISEGGEINYQTKIENIDGVVSKEAEIYIFRIVQECLNNISKHSKATEALVEIKNTDGKISILIADNGRGINNKLNGRGFGMIGIKERVSILKGDMEISSNKPLGTKISILI